SPASVVSPSPSWSVPAGATSHTKNLAATTFSIPSGPAAMGTSVEPSLVPDGAMTRSRYICPTCALAGTGTDSVPSCRVPVRCGLNGGNNQPTSTVPLPAFWTRLGAGRLGSCTNPTGLLKGGAGETGSTVALNWSVATSTPAASWSLTLQVAIPL